MLNISQLASIGFGFSIKCWWNIARKTYCTLKSKVRLIFAIFPPDYYAQKYSNVSKFLSKAQFVRKHICKTWRKALRRKIRKCECGFQRVTIINNRRQHYFLWLNLLIVKGGIIKLLLYLEIYTVSFVNAKLSLSISENCLTKKLTRKWFIAQYY